MPSRRAHQKSRHGCVQCKASHLKCDETRPVCSKCMRSGKKCLFTILPTSSPPSPASSSLSIPSTLPVRISSTSSTLPQHPQHDIQVARGSNQWSLSWQDMQLLHHYSVATYATFADPGHIREVWQITVPQIAFKHIFLMHGLLSVAALHLASESPETDIKYTDAAIRHHDLALAKYRQELNRINQENSSALFACSTMIVVFAFGFSLSRGPCGGDIQRPVEEITNIFSLLRGTYIIINQSWEWLREGELAALFLGRIDHHSAELPHGATASFQRLEEFLDSGWADCPERHAYKTSIQRLKDCFLNLLSECADHALVLSWPISVEPLYISLLVERKPMALVILAQYAAILDCVQSFWWAKQWGRQLLSDIGHMLSDDYQPFISWPQAAISEKQ